MSAGSRLTSRVRSVVVLRALSGVGDHLCSLPALRALRAGLPEAHIAVLTVPGAEQVLARFPRYVDELIPFAGFPGIPEKAFAPAELPPFYARMVDRHFDLALQMQGNGLVSNSLVMMLGADVTAGYHLPGHYCPDPDWFIEYPAQLPEIRRHLALMESLGLPSRGERVDFLVTADDRENLRKTLAPLTPRAVGGGRRGDVTRGGTPYVCIHPGAMAEARRWSPVGFAGVADMLAGMGYTVLFTGQAAEAGLTAHIRGLMTRPAVDLAGKTDLGMLAALLEDAALVVCNDTGVSHLASAVRAPSVVIFAGTLEAGSDPGRWAPLDRELHRVVARDTGGPNRDEDSPEVSLAQVWEAVHEQIVRGRWSEYGAGRRGAPAAEGRPDLRLVHA